MSIPHGGVRPEWMAANNFVMVHLDLVDALNGSWEAAGLLNRIIFRAGKDGWWVATLTDMREDCRLTEHKMKRCIQELRDAGMLESERVRPFESTMRWRVVFAGDDRVDRDGDGIIPGEDATSFLEVAETSIPSSLEERGELERTPLPSPTLIDAGFDQFWGLYPRKQGKQAARKAWGKVAKDVGERVLVEALVLQLPALVMEQKRGFCPHPATWLNQGRWEDDVSAINSRPAEGSSYLRSAERMAAEQGDLFGGMRGIGS